MLAEKKHYIRKEHGPKLWGMDYGKNNNDENATKFSPFWYEIS